MHLAQEIDRDRKCLTTFGFSVFFSFFFLFQMKYNKSTETDLLRTKCNVIFPLWQSFRCYPLMKMSKTKSKPGAAWDI